MSETLKCFAPKPLAVLRVKWRVFWKSEESHSGSVLVFTALNHLNSQDVDSLPELIQKAIIQPYSLNIGPVVPCMNSMIL